MLSGHKNTMYESLVKPDKSCLTSCFFLFHKRRVIKAFFVTSATSHQPSLFTYSRLLILIPIDETKYILIYVMRPINLKYSVLIMKIVKKHVCHLQHSLNLSAGTNLDYVFHCWVDFWDRTYNIFDIVVFPTHFYLVFFECHICAV